MIKNSVVDISRIIEHPDNYNKHPEAQIKSLRESVRAFGQVRSVVLQAPHDANGDYLCVAGNGVTEAMRQEGFTEVKADIVPSDWPPHRVRAYLIADNEQAKGSDPDLEQLAVLARDIQAIEPDLLMALAADAMGELVKPPEEPADAEPQINRADELQKVWQVEPGQLWRLPSRTAGQEHRLICGDCTDGDVVSRALNGDKPVVIFTDPPYGVSIGKKNVMLNSFQKAGRNLTDIVSDDLSPEKLKEILLPAFSSAKQRMADDCSVFVTAPQGGELGSMMMMMMMMMEAGLPIRHVLNWIKNAQTFSMGRLDYDYKHEPILFTWGKKHRKNKGDGFVNSCWEIDKPRASAEHPTMKPVELYEQAYANHCDEGEVVYEMFSGSGTAIIAAENLSRQCRAVEIAPAYVAVSLQRYVDAFGIEPELMM